MEKLNLKEVIYQCISNILNRELKEYATLQEIYYEVATYLNAENNEILQSQIRGRLQENCDQYSSFIGEPIFFTEKVRSGKWTIKITKNKYARFAHNSYLITKDHWNTVEKVKEIPPGFVAEENLDYVYRGKLTYLLGSIRASIILEELQLIRKLLKEKNGIYKSNDGYGTAFEVFAISVIHKIEYEECINKYIVHGDQDGKIDAIYYGELKTLYIYQIKIGSIDDMAYENMKKNYDLCFQKKEPENGKNLYQFIQKNHELFKGRSLNFRSVSSNSKKDSNYNPDVIYQMFFENKLLPLKNNNLTLSILKPTLPNSSRYQYNVSTDGDNNFCFFIKACDLVQYLFEALGIDFRSCDKERIDISKYFADNVRGVLSLNHKMEHTILHEPKNFVKFNNGVNITGEVHDHGNEISIINPVINNGQQTITTLMRLDQNLANITIPLKITNEVDMTIKGKISQFSNDQVKVKAIDMLSLNPFVREVQAYLFNMNVSDDQRYFLEIYSSGKKSYYDILEKLYLPTHIIKLSDFMKLYFSVKVPKDLGLWKNSPSYQVENTKVNESFDFDLAFKTCEAIACFDVFLQDLDYKKEKDDFKSADLAFKYLLCAKKMSVKEAAQIIRNINQTYYYELSDEKSKLIDIYKSPTIITKIETEYEIYMKTKKQKDTV